MPDTIDSLPAPTKTATAQPEMANLAAIASKKEGVSRNVLNAAEVAEKLTALGEDRLRDTDEERAGKAQQWLGSVARKWLLREGEVEDVKRSDADLGNLPKWAQESLSQGLSVIRVVLSDEEKERIEHIVDWLRADNGPSLTSDWSRISVAQAEKGVESWIADNARAAERRLAEQADIDVDANGVRTVMELEKGWRWVQVVSPDSLDREGSLMRHCVGSYAKQVAAGEIKIWSLRDENNQPRLTIESRLHELKQLKAFANGVMDEEHGARVGQFVRNLPKELSSQGILTQEVEIVGADWARAGFFKARGEVVHGSEITGEQLASFLRAVEGVPEDSRDWNFGGASQNFLNKNELAEAAAGWAEKKKGFVSARRTMEATMTLLKGMSRKLGTENTSGEFPPILEKFITLLPNDTLFSTDKDGETAYQTGNIEGWWLAGVYSQKNPALSSKARHAVCARWEGRSEETLLAALCVALNQTHKTIPGAKDLYEKSVELCSSDLLAPKFAEMLDRKLILPMMLAFDKKKLDWISESAKKGFGYRGGSIVRFAEKFDLSPDELALLLANRKREKIRELSNMSRPKPIETNAEEWSKKARLLEYQIPQSHKREDQQLIFRAGHRAEMFVSGKREIGLRSVDRMMALISFIPLDTWPQKEKNQFEAFAKKFAPHLLEKLSDDHLSKELRVEAAEPMAPAGEPEANSQLRGVGEWRRENDGRPLADNEPTPTRTGLGPTM